MQYCYIIAHLYFPSNTRLDLFLTQTPKQLLKADLLSQIGAREPLYISALKYAGCELQALHEVDVLPQLDVVAYKEKLEALASKVHETKVTDEHEVFHTKMSTCTFSIH